MGKKDSKYLKHLQWALMIIQDSSLDEDELHAALTSWFEETVRIVDEAAAN